MTHFAHGQTRRLVERLALNLERTREDAGEKAVHDLRTGIRRLKAALRTFRPHFRKSGVKRLRRTLDRLMEPAGVVRDRDVVRKLASKGGAGARSAIGMELKRQRDSAAVELVRESRSVLEKRSTDEWMELLGEREAPPASPAASLLPLLDEYLTAGRALASGEPDAETLHRFRLQGKRLRYAMELFQPLYGRAFTGYLERMRAAQTHLGEFNDCATLLRLLPELGAAEAESASLQAFLERRSAALLDGFRRFWREEMDARGREAQWKRYLSQHRPAAAGKTGAGTVLCDHDSQPLPPD